MTAPDSLPALLESLTQSLSTGLEVGPKVSAIEAPQNGVSLLDTKNELLLSYLQNIVFLILTKLRNSKPNTTSHDLQDVVRKLAELRLYMERGVRPLEEKLRFSIDNMLRAADDAERNDIASKKPSRIGGRQAGKDDDNSDSEDQSGPGSDGEAAEDSDEDAAPRKARLAAFQPAVKERPSTESNETPGVWRPSKTRRVVMPDTEPREKRERQAHKSATVEEYVATELSAAPLAEPSVGTTIVARGRKIKTAADRKEEAEKRDYEERNFVRLPKESKKDRAKKAKISGRSGRMEFGGEEWRDLGEGVDRINRLTKRKDAPSGTRALLERSRKRALDSGSGHVEMGDKFNKRLKVLESGRRDRGKRR